MEALASMPKAAPMNHGDCDLERFNRRNGQCVDFVGSSCLCFLFLLVLHFFFFWGGEGVVLRCVV